MGVRVPGFLAYSTPSRPRLLGILDLNAKWARVGTVGQVLVDGLVAGHAGGIDVLQLEDDALGLRLRQLLVQPQQCLAQPPLQQHLPLVAALGCQRCARRTYVHPSRSSSWHAGASARSNSVRLAAGVVMV